MKRSFASTIALSLAALAVVAAIPAAVAAPPPSDSEPPITTTRDETLRATATTPQTRTGAMTLTVTGARPGERVEGTVGPMSPVETLDPPASAQRIVEADSTGRAVITLPAPVDGWESGTQYAWVVSAPHRGALDRGFFATPLWPDTTEPPAVTFQVTAQLPKDKRDPIVLTVRGAKPGKVEVAFGPSTEGQPQTGGSADVGADGRAVVSIQPSGSGWRAGERYVWYATSGELLSAGSVTMPTWTPDGRTPKPGKPTTPPKEHTGGLSKTGA